jgi:hypothetical protein
MLPMMRQAWEIALDIWPILQNHRPGQSQWNQMRCSLSSWPVNGVFVQYFTSLKTKSRHDLILTIQKPELAFLTQLSGKLF